MTVNNENRTFLIIDFEATCSNSKQEVPSSEMEIIEFAGILIDSSYHIIREFTEFVKPVRHPKLTKFCTELTSITQEDVNNAKLFPEVLESFNSKIFNNKALFLSWGNYDKHQLLRDCEYHNVPYPFSENNHFNIKQKVNEQLKFNKQRGISGVLKKLDLRFEGTQHRGIDDVRNIIIILKHIKFPLNELTIKNM